MRAKAEQRRAEAAADELLRGLWDLDAEPVANPIDALAKLAGQMRHAGNVLGARAEVEGLDSAAALAWTRVIRELRQGLAEMARLGIAERHVELEQERAGIVVAAFTAALNVLGLVPESRSLAIEVFLRELEPVAPAAVVAGEVE